MKLLARKEYLTIFLIQITEVLGFSLILPFLPFYAKELGANPFQISLMLTVFSAFQFFMAPVMGKLSDRFGRRPLLLFSQLSTFASFLLLAFADNIWMLFASRLIDGLFGSNFVIAQAYLSDISNEEDRTEAFGLSGMAFGFGFMVGPAIGGFLAKNVSYQMPAWIAAALSLITMVMTVVILKETITKAKGDKFKLSWEMFELNNFSKYFKIEELRELFIVFFLFLLSQVVLTSNMAIFADMKFGLDSQDMGIILGGVGLINVLMRGVFLGKLLKKFGEAKLLKASFVFLFASFFALLFIKSGKIFLLPMMTFAIGLGLFRPIVMGSVSKHSPKGESGAVLGVTNSLGSLGQILGPVAGGFLLNNYQPNSLIYLEIFILMVVGFVMSKLDIIEKTRR